MAETQIIAFQWLLKKVDKTAVCFTIAQGLQVGLGLMANHLDHQIGHLLGTAVIELNQMPPNEVIVNWSNFAKLQQNELELLLFFQANLALVVQILADKQFIFRQHSQIF